MDKATVIKLRKELRHLCGDDRNATLPLRVLGPTTNFAFDDWECCFIWDDDSEILYIVTPNTTYTHSTDQRVFPMQIFTMDYASITFMSVAVDRLSLNNFFADKVSKGLTNKDTQDRYFKQMTDLWDPRTYTMGDPSPTTEKRGMRPDDEIMDKNATKFL